MLRQHPETLHPTEMSSEAAAAPLPKAEAPQTVEVASHHLTVFVESPPLIESMVRDILAAKERIWLETYIFFNDHGGQMVADALKLKAKEGLDVRLLYDTIGSAATPSGFFNSMHEAGVQIHAYHSFLEGLRRFRPLTILNRRDHRKILVIDESIGYFGGMNIIDNVENVEQQKAESRPASSGWRDVHIRLEGRQQCDLAESFDRSWKQAHGEEVPKRSRKYRRALQLNGVSHNPADEVPESIRFFDSGPGTKNSRAARVFVRLLRTAQFQITISMAYFIPTGAVLRALLSARRRQVRIRVVVPGKSDVRLVQRATSYLYDKLVRRGFRIYERRQQMLHSKTMIVDDLYTVVGSCNMDPRSLYINLEFLAVIRSHKLAAIMQDICRFEVAHSERITIAHCRRVGWSQRLVNRMAWAMRLWL